jgi:hypothetical protein
MSTEIKPGQTWADKNGDRLHVELVRPAHVEFKWEVGIMAILTTAEFLSAYELVEDATPAPLDPPAIHAGDTVTAEHEDGDVITAVVKRYEPLHAVFGPQMPVITTMGGFDIPVGIRGAWTLTAHQLAPKPEWKPGTTGTATLNNLVSGNAALGMRVMRFANSDGSLGFTTVTGLSILDSATTWSISDFVPDAEVPTREHLAGALANRYGDRDNLGDADLATQQAYLNDADAVLALLRGESL